MKVKLLFLAFFSCLIIIGANSCKGDQGDVGPQGPPGPEGPIGQDGVENCMDCHNNSQLISEKLFQWEFSVHATGGHYERNTASCAGCHTSQGFLDRLATGGMTASMTIENPLPQNCYTCHQIHSTYTSADWEPTTADPVTFWVGGETVDLGNSNLCINCHQARVPTPAVPPVGETADYNITNKRYGPHHGAQGMMFTGLGGYELDGSESYTNSLHEQLIEKACINCHMAAIDGANEAGGHTFRVRAEGGGDINEAGCIQCHEDLINADQFQDYVSDTQTEIQMLLDSLSNILLDRGILNPNDLPYADVPLDLSSLELGILWNYQYVREDQSLGVHNYKYAKALLLNSIEALQ